MEIGETIREVELIPAEDPVPARETVPVGPVEDD